MANALINSAPLVAGIMDPAARSNLVKKTIFPVSRLLVGNDLADKLKFPKNGMVRMRLALYQFRLNNLLEHFLGKSNSKMVTAFGASLYDNAGLRYDMPDHEHAEKSSSW